MKSAAYSSIVALLADLEPRHGWVSALELPRLSAEDVAIVCAEYPLDVDGSIEFSVMPLIESIRTGDVCHIGLKVAVAIAEAARDLVWMDVQEECEKRREDEENEYAEAHPESPESAHGVASLFRDSHR